jgi:hypothetical protein
LDLSPEVNRDAVKLLDGPLPEPSNGNLTATEPTP